MIFNALKISTKTVLYALVGVMILVVLLVSVLRTSYVQTKLAQYFAPKISTALGYPIEVDKVTIHFFDEATLEGVRVKDYQGYQMIDIEKLDVDFQLKSLVQDSTQNVLDYVRLFRPKVVLVIDKKGDLNIDEFIRRINKLTASKEPRPKNHKPSPFIIREADIQDGIFTLNDESEPYLNSRQSFDHYHFTLHELEAHLNDFTLIRDTVSFKTTLKGYDRFSNTRVKELTTNFLISDTQMRFDNLLLKLNNSTVKNQILMSFKSQKDFKHWNSKVRMRANFDSTFVTSDDLGRFVNDMYEFKDAYYLNGKFDGIVNDFKLQNFDLYFGEKSKLRGDFAFKGLPSISKAHMQLAMKKSHVQVEDLQNYIGPDPVKAIKKFGYVNFDGTFVGTISEFKTTGLLESELGKLDVDVSMVLKPESAKSTYSGLVKAQEFKIGTLLEETLLGNVSLNGKIEGHGFSWKDSELQFDGDINSLQFNKYDYKNVYVKGKLAKQLFDGRVIVNDTNLVFNLYGKVDLRNQKERVDLFGKLTKANLRNLFFTKDDWRISTYLDVEFDGINVDKLKGGALLYHTVLGYNTRNLYVDTVRFTSKILPQERLWSLESPQADVAFRGKFLPSKATQDLMQLVKEYSLYFVGNEQERNDYYAKKPYFVPLNYEIDYLLTLKDFYPFMALVYPEGKISKNTQFKGSFGIGSTSTFSLESKIDTLILGKNYQFYGSHIDLNSSKFYNSPAVLASVVLNSQKQKISILEPTEKFDLEASWGDDNSIRFTSKIRQQNTTNEATLNGTLGFMQEGISLKFNKSEFKVLDKRWQINPENLVTIVGKDLGAQNFMIANDDQYIALDGKISEDSTEAMNFKAKNFSLETLAPVVALNISGTVDADVSLKEVYKHINADSQLRIEGLTLDNFLIGNFEGSGIYDQEAHIVRLDYDLERLNNHILKFQGTYDPMQETNSLNLTANLNQTSLQILEPFTKGVFSNLKGTASGDLKITGNLRHPIFNGVIDVKKGSLFFDYLKTTLNFEDKIHFDVDEIFAKKMTVYDDEGNKASLMGGVYYDGSNNFSLGLNLNLSRFKLLNTTKRDNNLYYGTGYASGKVSIDGPFNNIVIDANLISDRGTRLYIPLDNAQDAGSQEEIEFLVAKNPDESKNEKKKKEDTSSRIRMDFKFEFTPDAYGEVQFDKQTGDIMRAYGAGKINLKIDTKGDFSMTGDYALDRGDYTFTFQNIINKKFSIQRGSRISWSGNPYEAMLDIRAAYTQNVNYLGSVIDTVSTGSSTYKNRPEFTRRYPVDVIIQLRDRLLQPAISFDLKLHDYPQNPEFNSGVTAFQNRIRTDEQELNRQVSNVLLLGQMVSNSAAAFASVNLVNNLMELASNQLSNVFSKIDQNLNVDLTFNGSGLNQDLINNLQLRFSYNFNDRFRITRSGGFTTALNQTNALSLIGDWSLEWFIQRDGSLRLKTYNRNVQTSILGSLNTQYQTFTSGGMSILYSKSFNYLFPNKYKKPAKETTE